jgi:alkylhydroperoxidase family enzyme
VAPTWLPETASRATPFERAFALSPSVYEHFADMYRKVWEPPSLDPALLELVRLRVAQLLRATGELRLRHRPALDAGLTEEKISALANWPTSPLFDDTDRAVLAFTEIFVIDAHAVEDEQCHALNARLSPTELATFTMALAIFEAMTRFRLALGVEPPDGTDPVIVDPAVDPLY